MIRDDRRRPVSGWSILPRLVEGARPAVLVVVGALTLLFGLLVITRPLTSLVLLTIYIGISAVFTGIAQLVSGTAPRRTRRILAGLWIVLGLAIIIGLGRTLDLLPDILAVLLVLGGLASLLGLFTRRGLSRRVLAVAWGGAQIVFGILSASWPDVTMLLVAVVFGFRTIVFGAVLLVRAVRAYVAGRQTMPADASIPPDSAPEPSPRLRAWAAAGRFALSALLVVTAAGGWWLNDWLGEGAPVVDAFYDPPQEMPTEHGRLIRYDEFVGQKPPGADVHRILYTTRDALGRRAVASALVISPHEKPGGVRPVIAWNHGTTGVARGCAPSLRDASATRWAIPGLNEVIERGWYVVASDYSGQGAPGTFPYLIGRGEARSSLDAVLAARELPGVSMSNRTVAWGHSQGGHAALWMTQIAPEYAPRLDLVGTALLAPVTDPLALAEELISGDAGVELSILISWVLVPYADTYGDVNLADYVTPGARTIVREMAQRCPTEPGMVVSVAAALGVSEDVPLYDGDLTSGALGRHLANNNPTGPWEKPLLVAWGADDEVIPPRLQHEFVQRACAQGEQVRWLEYRRLDHLRILQPRSRFLSALERWTADVLAGVTPYNDCEREG